MAILFINNKFNLFENANCGGANRTMAFIEALTNVDEVELVSFRGGRDVSSLPKCKVIFDSYIANKQNIQHSNRIIKFLNLFNQKDINKVYPTTEKKVSIVKSLMRTGKYQYVACRYIDEAVSCGLMDFADKLILDTDDNPTKLLLSGNSSKYSSLRSRIFHILFAISTQHLINNYLKKIHIVFHSSPAERHAKNSQLLHNISAAPHPNENIISIKTPLRVLMVGNFYLPMNNEGVRHFVSKIWPRVLNNTPDAEFQIVGANIDENLHNFLCSYKNVIVKGHVQDLSPEYMDCRVVVIPIYEGTGTSIKTVEAMLMKRPFVSSKIGVRGFSSQLVDGKDYFLAIDDKSFANNISKLLEDIKLSNEIAENAYQKYKKYWSKQKFIDIVCSSIKKSNAVC